MNNNYIFAYETTRDNVKNLGEEFEEILKFSMWMDLDREMLNSDIMNIICPQKNDIKYLFDINDKIDIDNLLNNDDLIIVVGYKKTSFNIEAFRHKWNIFNNIKEAKEFINSLVQEKPIYCFNLKDNCYDVVINEIKEKQKQKESYRMRNVFFDGDIIITDPCYIVKKRDESSRPKWSDFHPYSSLYEYPDYDGKESKMFQENYQKLEDADEQWKRTHPSDVDLCDDYDNMEALGFTDCITHQTLCGDWSCRTINSDTKEILGEFCADAGMVGIFLKKDILKYNPSFFEDYKPFTYTLIENFKGNVCFKISKKNILSIKGKGNINFHTKQIGF